MSDESTPIHIDDALAAIVGEAFDNGRPVMVAYVDGEGQPHLSFRGSAQGFSKDQLALWIREPQGGLLHAIKSNPRLTMMYRDSSSKTTYIFYGRAQRVNDPVISQKIYDTTPKGERDRDPDMGGVAVVVDIDVIQGSNAGQRVNMRR